MASKAALRFSRPSSVSTEMTRGISVYSLPSPSRLTREGTHLNFANQFRPLLRFLKKHRQQRGKVVLQQIRLVLGRCAHRCYRQPPHKLK